MSSYSTPSQPKPLWDTGIFDFVENDTINLLHMDFVVVDVFAWHNVCGECPNPNQCIARATVFGNIKMMSIFWWNTKNVNTVRGLYMSNHPKCWTIWFEWNFADLLILMAQHKISTFRSVRAGVWELYLAKLWHVLPKRGVATLLLNPFSDRILTCIVGCKSTVNTSQMER